MGLSLYLKNMYVTFSVHPIWICHTYGIIVIIRQVDGDRGKWLYRGYLVGDLHGNFTGRWRDTLSPPAVAGYEGCFFMGRRR